MFGSAAFVQAITFAVSTVVDGGVRGSGACLFFSFPFFPFPFFLFFLFFLSVLPFPL